MGLLDLIFPKYCVNCKKYGDYLCSNCFSRLSWDTKNVCTACGNPSYDGLTHPKCKTKISAEGSFTGVVFNQVTKKLIYQFKYKPYLTNLASFMADLMYEKLIQDELFSRILNSKPILVPIPITKNRERKRGYNQSKILAKSLGKKFDLQVSDYLLRIKETRSQVGLNKKERNENMKDSFGINKKYSANLKNRRVILVDDVLTSGSTFSEAAKALKRSGVREVWALAFAKED